MTRPDKTVRVQLRLEIADLGVTENDKKLIIKQLNLCISATPQCLFV